MVGLDTSRDFFATTHLPLLTTQNARRLGGMKPLPLRRSMAGKALHHLAREMKILFEHRGPTADRESIPAGPNFDGMHTVRLKFGLGLAVTAWFLVVYVGCDQLTEGSNALRSVRLTLDNAIPFLPHLAPVYLSISLLVYLPLLVIDETARLVALALSFAFEIAVAGAVFLAFPVEANAHPPGDHGRMFEFLDLMNLTYNSLPSLHVAFAVSTALALHGMISGFWRAMLWTWTFLVVASTLLTKQHLIADAIAGGMLGIFSILVVCPLVQRAIAHCGGEEGS